MAIGLQCLLVISSLFLVTVVACANDIKPPSKSTEKSELIINGILIDRTVTPIGEHFFQAFCSNWSAPENAMFQSITFTERFSPQWGSMVWITIDDDETIYRLLINRSKDLDEMAKELSAAMGQYLLRRELLRHYQQSKDLYGDGY